MGKRLASILVVAVGLLALLLARGRFSNSSSPEFHAIEKGRNNTVLFFADSHAGRSNAQLAALLGLIEHHPEVDLHFASFKKLNPVVPRLQESYRARTGNPSRDITVYELPGYGVAQGVARNLGVPEDQLAEAMTKPRGLRGLEFSCEQLRAIFTANHVDDYRDMFNFALRTIHDVDPALVVVDPIMMPVMSAIAASNRKHVNISPDMLTVQISLTHPEQILPWKYPFMGAGYSFPMTWPESLANIWITIRFAYTVFMSQDLRRHTAELAEYGIQGPIALMRGPQNHSLISASFPEGNFPDLSVPSNIKICGPLLLDQEADTIAERDPDLARWLSQGPTVLINLGSIMKFDATSAGVMVNAVQTVMEETEVQVLWKFAPAASSKHDNFTQDMLRPVQKYVDQGRLRVVKWLAVDPPSLLKTGHFVLAVNHGGANSVSEAMNAGVPQLVLPKWADCYTFATLVEYLGIGIWPSKKTAPLWDSKELAAAFLALLGDSSDLKAAATKKAEELGRVARGYGGRECAADKIAEMAVVTTWQ